MNTTGLNLSSFRDFISTAIDNDTVPLTQSMINHIELGLSKLESGAKIHENGVMNISHVTPFEETLYPVELTGLSKVKGGAGIAYWLPITTRRDYKLLGLIFYVVTGEPDTYLRENDFMVSYLYENGVMVSEGTTHSSYNWFDLPRDWKYINLSLLNGRKLNRHRLNIDFISRNSLDGMEFIHTMGASGLPAIGPALTTIGGSPKVGVYGNRDTVSPDSPRTDVTSAYVELMSDIGGDESVEYDETTEEETSITLDDIMEMLDHKLLPVRDDVKHVYKSLELIVESLNNGLKLNHRIDHTVNLLNDRVSSLIHSQVNQPHYQQPFGFAHQQPQQAYGYGHPQQGFQQQQPHFGHQPQQQHFNGGYPKFGNAPGWGETQQQQPRQPDMNGGGGVVMSHKELDRINERLGTLEREVKRQALYIADVLKKETKREEAIRSATSSVEDLIDIVKAK